MSVKGKNGKGRSYSIVEDRDVSIAKALMFVLKRTITEGEVDEEEEVDNVVADAEGWVPLDHVVCVARCQPWFAQHDADKVFCVA